MSDLSSGPRSTDSQPGIRSLIAPFRSASVAMSAVQIATSLGLFIAAWAAMYWSEQVSYLLTLALAVPTAGLLVRVFIVQHDCGHGSFFKSRRANDIVGAICSLMTFTPYANWRRLHNLHHGAWNNLDTPAGWNRSLFRMPDCRGILVSARAGAVSPIGWSAIRSSGS